MFKENNTKSIVLHYSITLGVSLVICFLLSWLMGVFTPWEVLKVNTSWHFNNELTKVFFLLTNCTFIVGILASCFGLLIMAANGGAFEMLNYGLKRFFSLFQKDPTKVKFKTFYDYHTYNTDKPKTPFLYLVVVGLFFIALSCLFLFVYTSNYVPVVD